MRVEVQPDLRAFSGTLQGYRRETSGDSIHDGFSVVRCYLLVAQEQMSCTELCTLAAMAGAWFDPISSTELDMGAWYHHRESLGITKLATVVGGHPSKRRTTGTPFDVLVGKGVPT